MRKTIVAIPRVVGRSSDPKRRYEMQEHIYERMNFNASNMRGRNVRWDGERYVWPVVTHPAGGLGFTWGRLSDGLRGDLEADQPTYVVWSYLTPIAWWSPDKGWVMPEEKYSLTTTQHQSQVRQATGEPYWRRWV